MFRPICTVDFLPASMHRCLVDISHWFCITGRWHCGNLIFWFNMRYRLVDSIILLPNISDVVWSTASLCCPIFGCRLVDSFILLPNVGCCLVDSFILLFYVRIDGLDLMFKQHEQKCHSSAKDGETSSKYQMEHPSRFQTFVKHNCRQIVIELKTTYRYYPLKVKILFRILKVIILKKSMRN